MQERLSIQQITPKAQEAIMALENYLYNCSLKPTHKELIKFRASLINKCAFCIDMHRKDLLSKGETDLRLHMISTWQETNLFTEEEQLLFAITEELTLINQHGLSDQTYIKAIDVFGKEYLSHIIIAVCTINVWNRVAIATNMGALVKVQ